MRTRPFLAALVALSIGCNASPTTPTPRNYSGTWTGNFFVITCNATGLYQAQNVCTGLLGGFASYKFAFTQTGNAIGGTVDMGTLLFTLNPTAISSNDTLAFTVEGSEEPAAGFTSRVVAQWNLTQPNPDDLQGSNSTTFTVQPNASNTTGTLTFTSRLSSASVAR